MNKIRLKQYNVKQERICRPTCYVLSKEMREATKMAMKVVYKTPILVLSLL